MSDLHERFRDLNSLQPPGHVPSSRRSHPGFKLDGPRRSRSAAIVVALTVSAAAVALVARSFGGDQPAQTAGQPIDRIAFVQFSLPDDPGEDHQQGLWTMAAEGGQTEAIATDAWYSSPAWSPDGRYLAAVRFEWENPQRSEGIYVMRPDGTELREVLSTDEPLSVADLQWTPDGDNLAFIRVDRSNADSEAEYIQRLYMVPLSGMRFWALTEPSEQITSFAWSPDGGEIAYTVQADAGHRLPQDIFLMNSDGSNHRRLTANGWSNEPSWSPDGKQIAYTSDPQQARKLNEDLWVMDADGSNQTKLTSSPERDGSPTWSPDGQEIVISRYGGATNCSLLAVAADGSSERVLDDGAAGCPGDPVWQPAGSAETPTPSAPNAGGELLEGEELASALGLEPVSILQACRNFVEIPQDGMGYCIGQHLIDPRSFRASRLLAALLQGRAPSSVGPEYIAGAGDNGQTIKSVAREIEVEGATISNLRGGQPEVESVAYRSALLGIHLRSRADLESMLASLCTQGAEERSMTECQAIIE
ncbi:MAG: hypothetical protein WD556_13440 [Actinomycetota bacterium]